MRYARDYAREHPKPAPFDPPAPNESKRNPRETVENSAGVQFKFRFTKPLLCLPDTIDPREKK